MKRLTAAALLGLSLLAAPAYAANAPQMEIGRAEFYLKEFEKEVARAQGADMGRYYNKNEALSRIQNLAMAYPDDPKVKDLNTFAPLLEPVSSYSYIEAWQNACEYYIPNSMDVQIKRVMLD